MQAVKVRHLWFQRSVILILAIGVLASAIVFVAFYGDAFQSSGREPRIIERSAPVSRPSDERWLGFPHHQSAPSDDVHRPSDRP